MWEIWRYTRAPWYINWYKLTSFTYQSRPSFLARAVPGSRIIVTYPSVQATSSIAFILVWKQNVIGYNIDFISQCLLVDFTVWAFETLKDGNLPSVHSFYYHSLIVLIWLKYYQKECTIASHPSIVLSQENCALHLALPTSKYTLSHIPNCPKISIEKFEMVIYNDPVWVRTENSHIFSKLSHIQFDNNSK